MPVSNRNKRLLPTRAAQAVNHAEPMAATFDVTPSPYIDRKPVIDRFVACMLLIPGIPLMGLLILLVRLTSRGPGIFRQARMGKDGRVFTMLKIRTMRQDAESGLGATWSTADDPRSTYVGRWIRKLHLDELPQLFNVLRGEMSLVGPRPERPEFVCVLEEALPGYRNRVAVRPGVTGLAQLRLPPDTDLCSACRKLRLDLEYVHTATLATDVKVLLCTIIRVPKLPLRIALRLCGLRPEFSMPDCAHCQVYKCNGHNGHQNMTALALRHKVECVFSGGNGADRKAAGANGHTAPPVSKVTKPR